MLQRGTVLVLRRTPVVLLGRQYGKENGIRIHKRGMTNVTHSFIWPITRKNGTRSLSTITPTASRLPSNQHSMPIVSSSPANTNLDTSFSVLDRPTPPHHADRYQIGRQIGSGNYALVKEALDRKTGERVAIKIMDKRRCGAAICKNEVDVLLSLSRKVRHQRVTPVLDVFEDKDNLYIVLELLRGGELFERVVQRGRLPESEVAQILRKLVYALEALHRHGILHRDIKLENIVMRDDGTNDFKVADFGFALESKSSTPNTGLSRSVSFTSTAKASTIKLAGTLGYAAPEVLREARYGPACDVWSAGIVTFILLAGHPPFPLMDPDAMANASQEEKIQAELEAIEFGRAPENWKRTMNEEPWSSILPEAKNLVSRMLVLDPQRRITTRGILQDPFIRRYSESEVSEFTDFE